MTREAGPTRVPSTRRRTNAGRRFYGERRPNTYMDKLNALISHLRGEDGQGLAEYALILALIAIVAIVALIFLGTQISSILSVVGSSV